MPANHFLPAVGSENVGIRTPFGTLVPPGARVAAYVGPQSESTDAYSASSLLVSTLAAGLARCRSGKGDVVFVLPGHSETINTTQVALLNSALVAGTQIIGVAPFRSGLMPALTFNGTTNTTTWTVNVANVLMQGLKFNFNGADSIDTPLVFTAAGCRFANNVVNMGSDTTLDCDVGLTVSTGSDFMTIQDNLFYTTSTAVNTNSILVSAAVDSLSIVRNRFIVPATSTNGIIQVGASTVAITNIDIGNNVMVNKSTGSACISFTDQAHTGVCYENYSGLTANTAPLTTGIVLAGTTNILVQFFNNQTNDGEAKGTSGLLSPAVNDGT